MKGNVNTYEIFIWNFHGNCRICHISFWTSLPSINISFISSSSCVHLKLQCYWLAWYKSSPKWIRVMLNTNTVHHMKYWNEKFAISREQNLKKWVSLGLSDSHIFHEIHTFSNITVTIHYMGHAVVQMVDALCYKPEGLIPDDVIEVFHWHNPSGRSTALGLTQPLTEMSTRNISWG